MNRNYKRITLFLALIFILMPGLTFAQEFVDVEGHWAEQNLVRSLELQWIQGDGTNQLAPNRAMSRAEFVTMAYRTLGLENQEIDGSTSYHDLDTLPWAQDLLTQADRAGILNLTFPGTVFQPQREITREEAIVLLDNVEIFKKTLEDGVDPNEAVQLVREKMDQKSSIGLDSSRLPFIDGNEIEPAFVTSVVDFYNRDIVKGHDDGHFGPKESLTRAQAISLLLRTLNEEPISVELSEVAIIQRDGKSYLADPATGEQILRSQIEGGRLNVGDEVYLMNLDSSLRQGLFDENGETYYADAEKGLARGWREIDGKHYYFSPMDHRMYKDGIFSTGNNVYWFGEDGAVREGNRRGGHAKLNVYWHYPTEQEFANGWLEGEHQHLRFRGQEIANFAASFEGLPFHWYGTDLRNPAGVYCCGTTYSTYREFGIAIPGPNDVNMRKHNGYEMVRAQHEWASRFGGYKIPADFDQIWPGDLVFIYSPRFYLGFNHVGLYMGKNGGNPYYIHAALKNGLAVENPYKMIREQNRIFNSSFVRYNTDANPGNGTIPKK